MVSDLMMDSRRAARDDGKGNAAVLCVDVLEHLGNGLELWQQLVVEILLALGDGFDGHVEPVHSVERGDDFDGRLAAPGVKEFFVKFAAPLAERLLPGDVVERHGVDDGAVAVEEIGAEVAGGEFELHACSGTPCRCSVRFEHESKLRRSEAGSSGRALRRRRDAPPSPGLVGSIWSALLKRLK